jgi:uncharacterized protein (TIGR02246 family)
MNVGFRGGVFVAVTTISLSLLAGCASSMHGPRQGDDAAMEPVTRFVDALTNADIEKLLDAFTDDASLFTPFTSVPQRREGKEQIREAFTPMFASMRASGRTPPYMQITPRDVRIRYYGRTAVVTFHIGELPRAGATEPSSFARRTAVVTFSGDRWLIAHLHASNTRIGQPGG